MNPRTTHGNALALPWADGYFDAVCTSPTYGNRMADHHNAERRQATPHLPAHVRAQACTPTTAARCNGATPTARSTSRPGRRRGGCSTGRRVRAQIKDHIRGGVVQPVTEWHVMTLCGLGFVEREHKRINTPSMRYGRNADKRVEYESVILFTLEVQP